jgi:hypothetical protein
MFFDVIGWRELRTATLQSRIDGHKPRQSAGSSLHLRDTTVIITGGIIADHTGVTE